MKLLAIEGNTQQLDGGAMFGNAPREMWKHWLPPDDLNRIPLAARSLLMQTDSGENILFEAGVGAFFEPKYKERYGVVGNEHLLIQNLISHGFEDTDIHRVVLSHLHFDHAGGLLSAYKDPPIRLLFPNATFYTSKKNWERAIKPHVRDRASFIDDINTYLKKSGRLVLIEGDSHPDLPVHFSYSNGHTPGMMLSHINLKSGPLVFTADLIPGLPWIHVPIAMGYDRFAEKLIDEKKALLDELLKKKGHCFFTHDPYHSCVAIHQDEKGKFFGKPVEISSLV